MPKIKIKDRRKIDYVSKKPIGEKNNLSGEYDEEIVDRIIKSAKAHNIDPYTALAMGLQETQLGQGRFKNNPLHFNTVESFSADNKFIDTSMKYLVEKFDYAKKLNKKGEADIIQSWNGYGKYPLDYDLIGFENYINNNNIDIMDDKAVNKVKNQFIIPTNAYGRIITKDNPLDMNKEPVYGQKILDIRDNILKKDPLISRKIKKDFNTSSFIESENFKKDFNLKDKVVPIFKEGGKISNPGFDTGVQRKDNTWSIVTNQVQQNQEVFNARQDQQQTYLKPDTNIYTDKQKTEQRNYNKFDEKRDAVGNTIKSFGIDPRLPFTNPKEFAFQAALGALPIDKLGKLGKVLGKSEGLITNEVNKSITNSVLNPLKSKFSNSIEGLKMELENSKYRFNKNVRADSKQALKEANEWQKEWYNHPETQIRIDDRVRKQDKEVFNHMFDAVNNKNLIDHDIYKLHFGINPGWRGMKERIKNEDYKVNFENGINKVVNILGNNEPVHKGNLGVSGYGMDFTKDLFRNPNNLKRQNLVRKYMNPDSIKGVAVHEGNHGITDGNEIIASSKKEMQDAFHHPDNEAVIKNLGIKDASYYTDPTEIYARIMDLRNAEGLRPGQLLNITQIKNMITKGETGAYGRSLSKEFFQLIKDPEKFRKLMNTLPAVGGAAYIGSEKTKNTNNKWSIIN